MTEPRAFLWGGEALRLGAAGSARMSPRDRQAVGDLASDQPAARRCAVWPVREVTARGSNKQD